EHLVLMHLVEARAARSAGDPAAAQRAVEEGLHLATQRGLRLIHVELLVEQGEIDLAAGGAIRAEQAAREALRRAAGAGSPAPWGGRAAAPPLRRALPSAR